MSDNDDIEEQTDDGSAVLTDDPTPVLEPEASISDEPDDMVIDAEDLPQWWKAAAASGDLTQ